MMKFQVKVSLQTAQISDGSSDSSQRGPDAARFPPHTNFRQSVHLRRTFPAIQPLSKPRNEQSLLGGFIVGGCPNSSKDEKLEPEQDICGRHFLFDKKCESLERNRRIIPPLRDYHVHRPGNLHRFSLSEDLSHGHAPQPFTLSYANRYKLNTSPAILFPSAVVLSGRKSFSVDNCSLSRPKVNYPTCNLATITDSQKKQSYPDPVDEAPRSFMHRISELASLEAETVRQENLKKMRKPRKPS
ncbi:hypothetical protein LDENG_00082120 [Lucifuga dentata]|nr:hypothetical protein LDENG_00082120 [Lucifuga dentata]